MGEIGINTNDEGKLVRRNLMFPDNMVIEFEEIRVARGLESHSAVLQEAFKTYKQIIDNGGAAYTHNSDCTVTKIIPI